MTPEALVSDVLVEQGIFRHVLGIKWTGDDELALHGSPVHHLHHVYEVLGGLEAANELGMVWGAGGNSTEYDGK